MYDQTPASPRDLARNLHTFARPCQAPRTIEAQRRMRATARASHPL